MKATGIVLSIDGLDHIAILHRTMRILATDPSLNTLNALEMFGRGMLGLGVRVGT